MKNIICSTTRSWNCGDDFILFGVRNLLSHVFEDANIIAFNRNPVIMLPRIKLNKNMKMEQGDNVINSNPWTGFAMDRYAALDNSWHPRHGMESFDLCVFAGTPEWMNVSVEPLVNALCESETPVLYLGIGHFEDTVNMPFKNIPEKDRKTLEKAALITVRDSQTLKMLNPVKPIQMPCPALFSSKQHKIRPSKIRRLAFSTQRTGTQVQDVDQKTYDYSLELLKALSEDYDIDIICHYVDEVPHFQKKLGDRFRIRYSYDPRDYLDIYNDYDLNITTRVHGAGICASLGIPSFVLMHSARSETVDGFLSEKLNINDTTIDAAILCIKNLDVEKRSQEIVRHKQQALNSYLDLLAPLNL